MDAEYIESCVKGSIVGLLIGDALGFPYSDEKRIIIDRIDMIAGKKDEAPGSYQGPGALTLCTMASLNELERIDPDDILDKFSDFMVAGYLGSSDSCSDISEITVQSIKNHTNGMPPDRCGTKDEGSNDGECIVRMLPVALWCINDPIEQIMETVHNMCQITHAEARSQVACVVYCLIIRNLFLQESEKVFDILNSHYENNYAKALDFLRYWADNNVVDGKKGPESCFWSAWKAFAEFENDYRGCVTKVIALGNDANTNGAVAGSLSALVNGISNIPTKWLNTLVLTDEIMETINTFTSKITNRVQGSA